MICGIKIGIKVTSATPKIGIDSRKEESHVEKKVLLTTNINLK